MIFLYISGRPTTAHSLQSMSSRALSGHKKSPVPSVIISKSTDTSRPSTGVISRESKPRSRPMSAASTKICKGSPSPETSFKTHLSAWKNEK
jgi:hypothetical protein